MQYLTVSIPGFLFLFLICMPDFVDAKTQNPVRRRYRKDGKENCVEVSTKIKRPAEIELFEDADCQIPFVYRKRQLTTLKSVKNKTMEKAVDLKKSRLSRPTKSAEKMPKIERAYKVNGSSISRNMRKSRKTSKSGLKSTKATKQPPPTATQPENVPITTPATEERKRAQPKSNIAPSSSCDGQILRKIFSTDKCDLLDRTARVPIVTNVTCQDYTGCFMTDNLYCKGFQNEKWEAVDFEKCDTDFRIIRAVEKDSSKPGKKSCRITMKKSLGDFKRQQIFNSRSDCLNTYYIPDNDACMPKLKKEISKDDVFFYVKEACENAIANVVGKDII